MRTVLISILLLLAISACQSKDKIKNEIEKTNNKNETGVDPEKVYAQHIILKLNKADLEDVDSLANWITDFLPGGLSFEDWPIEKIQELSIRLDSTCEIKPFFLGDYFKLIEMPEYPVWAINSTHNSSILYRGFQEAGLSWLTFNEPIFMNIKAREKLDELKDEKIINPIFFIDLKRNNYVQLSEKMSLLQNSSRTVFIQTNNLDSLPYRQIKKLSNFKGLFISQTNTSHLLHLKAGADMVFIESKALLNPNTWKPTSTNLQSFYKIIELKERIAYETRKQNVKPLIKASGYHYIANSTALINSKKRFLPLNKIYSLEIKSVLNQTKLKTKRKYILNIPYHIADSTLEKVIEFKELNQVLILFSNPTQHKRLKKTPNLCFSPIKNSADNSIVKAQLLGQVSIQANFLNGYKIIKCKTIKSTSIAHVPPEFAFVDRKVMNEISGIISQAIDGRAFPGCQVLAIKNDVLIFQKSYGKTAYRNGAIVNTNHVYDLASLTKVLATTLVGMKLYEQGYYKLDDEIGKYLPDSLNKHLPNGNTIAQITFRELFIHKSGLPAGFPVIKYMRKAANSDSRYSTGFCDYQFTNFDTKVADNLFLENVYQDSMWLKLNSLWLDPAKPYKYSDVNMNVLYFVFKRMIETHSNLKPKRNYKQRNPYNQYLNNIFYEPLTMKSTGFNLLSFMDKNRIVPTENERFWRKQLLQGYVHDPNAALYGGVAGNAGLFSNVNDLSKLLQMWLNGGIYNGKRYLKTETINEFITTQANSHRGLGFNKGTITNSAYAMADSADVLAYGHTGFTGTCFWVDPKEKLVYVFLSNRVHPKISNKIYQFGVRKRIHQVFYDAQLK